MKNTDTLRGIFKQKVYFRNLTN